MPIKAGKSRATIGKTLKNYRAGRSINRQGRSMARAQRVNRQ